MTLGAFVRKNRPRWQKLETMLGAIETRGTRRTSRPFLQELSALYRSTTGDLAFAQTHYRGTTLLLFLHQLVARAHHQIYRPHRLTPRVIGRFFRNDIPLAVREHLQAVLWSGIVFLLGVALGLSAVQVNERVALLVLPTEVLNSIYSGHMWTGSVFNVLPGIVSSTFLFTSNISVALFAFIGGLSFGLLTFWILFVNGFLLGVVLKLCANYGLLGLALQFIAGHGILEVSAIIVSGGAGFVVANALLNPGFWPRAGALAIQGRSAVRMALASVPALVIAGCIEAFVSPSHFPVWFKIVLGLMLGGLFWMYLLLTGRPGKNPSGMQRS
ncbi:MAG TPA: stage II sporulation protein M [Candidatus Methylacidiphilales bacterium]|nr:stage II sporulation protein M [Candidatus Methylacidiphilales bacterium]